LLKVAVVSGSVKYYRNNTLLYSSLTSPSYPLYLDTSFYTSNSTLAGGLLCAGSQCVGTPEYTSYYSLGAKVVGMRRVNAASGNGQFRIVGDHLGSTTLIVDTASPPNVVQRQYHKPYGETAWQYTASTTGGESLTNVGYTGQRTDEDSSGLMFYNARLYDPILSVFTSADTISPDKMDPISRNKFMYTSGNPLRYVDPSGRCDNPASDSRDAREGETCESAEDTLNSYGIYIRDMGDWSLAMLLELIDGISHLMSAMQWTTIEEFKYAIGIYDDSTVIYVSLAVDHDGTGYGGRYYRVGESDPSPLGNPDSTTRNIVLQDIGALGGINPKDPHDLGSTFVHELAHAWDNAHGLSEGMRQSTGSKFTDMILSDARYYRAGGEAASDYSGSGIQGNYFGQAGNHGPQEDWAESVAALAYPDRSEYTKADGSLRMDGTRQSYVRRMALQTTLAVRVNGQLPPGPGR
jgi:RHS repeat-associated protein